jgi:hypothetical protein
MNRPQGDLLACGRSLRWSPLGLPASRVGGVALGARGMWRAIWGATARLVVALPPRLDAAKGEDPEK